MKLKGRDAPGQTPNFGKAHLMAGNSVWCAFLLGKVFSKPFGSLKSTLNCIGVIIAITSVLVPFSVLFGQPTSPAQAATSNTLNFQGRLLTNTGSLVPDGTYNVQFNLYYQSSGGTSQWTETRTNQGANPVSIQNGYYSVYLGDTTSGGTAFPSTIDWSEDLYLGMTIRGTGTCAFGACSPTDSEMTPRFKLTAVPYALRSSNVASSNTNASSSNSDNVSITTGDALGSSSNSGNITIDVGTATGTTGTITLGATNASALTLGRTGLTTQNAGALTVAELLTATGNLTVNGNTTIGNANSDSLTINAGTSGTGIRLADSSFFSCTALETDASGDITCGTDDTGGGITLQGAYTADTDGSDAEILLTSADGAIRIRDASTTVGNLFTIEANGGSDYLNVTAGSTTIGNDLTVSSGNSLILVGSGTYPGSPTEGEVYYDSTNNEVMIYNGTRWEQLNGNSSATYVVSTTNSVRPELADYRANGDTGSAGDGDQVEINSAITAANSAGGGTVYLMEGTYNIDASIVMRSNVALVGAGKGTVITIPNGANPSSIVFIDIGLSGTINTEIRRLRLEGNGANNTISTHYGIQTDEGTLADKGTMVDSVAVNGFEDYGLYFSGDNHTITNSSFDGEGLGGTAILTNSSYTTVDGNSITGFDIGIYDIGDYNTYSNNDLRLINNTAINNDGDFATITGNVINTTATNGVYLSSNNTTISGNAITATSRGIYSIGTQNASINGNTFNATEVNLANCERCSVVGNSILNSPDNGISIGNVSSNTDNLISGNTIIGSTDDGIYISDDGGRNVISNNTIASSGTDGIHIRGSDNNVIIGNSIYNSAGTGNNSGIEIRASLTNQKGDNNQVIGNRITDTAGTGVAILIESSFVENTYLADNTYSGTGASSISDSGTNTRYANQLTPTQILQSGNSLIRGRASTVITGSIDPTASTSVTGVGTAFTTELQVGDRITVSGETRTIVTITNATSLTVDTAFSDNANDTAVDRLIAGLVVQDSSSNIDFIIADNGYVGIGIVAPTVELDVTGSGRFSSNVTVNGNTTIGSANTDTLTINAGTSGTGVRLADSSFFSCTALETDASGDITCGTDDVGGGGGSLFTDGGTFTYLTATADDLVLGATTVADGTFFMDVSAGSLRVGSTGTTDIAGSLIIADTNGDTTTLQAGNSSGNITFTLPTSTGSSNQCVKNSTTPGELTFANCNNGSGGGGAITLDDAYEAGNQITTSDARDIIFTLADTASDSGFTVNLQGTTGDFAVQDAGSDVFTVADGGAVTATGALTVQGNVTIGNANTDTLTINAGTSGTGIRLADSSFFSCTALETDASGDITCGTDDTGGGITLQGAYTADTDGSDAEILLTSADGAIRIRDASTTVGNLFTIEANGGSDYLNVTAGSTTIGNDLTVSSGNSLILVGSGTYPGSPTEGEVYYDSTNNEVMIYNGTRWEQLNGNSSATYVVSTTNSVRPELADYRANGDTGSAGDGDQVEINAAITAANSAGGGTVYLMEGTYTIDAKVNLASNVSLVGAGNSTIITIANGLNPGGISYIDDNGSGKTGVYVGNLRIEGNGANNTTGIGHTGIDFNGGTANDPGIHIDRVSVNGFEWMGINVAGTNNKVTNSSLDGEDLGDYGIYSTATDTVISGNYITQYGRGIFVDSSRIVISENTIFDTNGRGIVTEGQGATIVGNTIRNPGSYGLDITLANNTIASGNYIYGGSGGIQCTASSDTQITGNQIQDQTGDGINANGCDRTSISGNTVFSVDADGIYLQESDFSIISGNTLTQNLGSGIKLGTFGVTNTSIIGNTLYDNGGTSSASSIAITWGSSSSNNIIGNNIIDTAGTGFAIGITSGVTNTYLEGNVYSGTGATTIDDSGTGTRYANQLTPTQILQSGNSLIRGRASTVITGSIDPTASTSVTGVGTAFTTELQVGDRITVSGETRTIVTITNATSLTVDTAFSDNANDTAVDRLIAGLVVQDSAGAVDVLVQDDGSLDVWSGTLTVGTDTQAGTVTISDGSSNTGTIQLASTAGNYTFTIPTVTANDTFCLVGLANCAGSASTLQGAYDADPNSADAQIVLTSNDGSLLIRDASTPLTTAFAIQNNAGGSNYLSVASTGITLGVSTTLAANQSLTVTGGATGTRPGTPSEGMIYYDTTTDSLITYANGKWQADRTTTTYIVAANDSTQRAKDAADYVANGNTGAALDGDQVEINAAISAAVSAGKGVIYLMPGTYTIDEYIDFNSATRSNITLAGSGDSTVITVPNALNMSSAMIYVNDADYVTIRDIKFDGNRANQSSGGMAAIGAASSALFITIESVHVINSYDVGISAGNRPVNGRIVNSIVENSRNDGIQAGEEFVVDGNTVIGSGGNGISVAARTIVSNNYLENNSDGSGEANIYHNGWTGVSIIGNTINGGYNGILASNADSVTISANTVTSTTNTGIQSSVSRSSVMGNTVISSGARGIYVQNGSDTVVSGNTVQSAGTLGIAVAFSATRVQLNNNSVNNSTQSGIYIETPDTLVNGNTIYNSGGSGSSHGIEIDNSFNPDNTRIIGNVITDTAGTGYAINICASCNNTYLADNAYSGTGATTINDLSSTTRYANQLTPTQILQSGNSLIRGRASTVITGSIDPTASTSVTGVGTAFTTELQVGDRITVSGETRTIVTITNATSLTVDTAFSDNANDTAVDRLIAGLVVQDSAGAVDVLVQDDGSLDVWSGTLTVGTDTQAGTVTISDGSSNTGTIQLASTAGNYTFTIPTVTANDTFCLVGLANCSGSATTLQGTYAADTDGSDATISLTTADDSIVFSNPSSSGTDSAFVLKVEQLNTGAGVDALLVSNSGTGNIATFQDTGTTVLGITDGGNLVANNSATGATGTTTGTGTNTTTLNLTSDPFSVNDVIYIDNVGQDYVTRITVDPGTNSYTVSPAVTFETGRTVTRYIRVQNIGATSTDYTTLGNRFFEGYFLGSVNVGTGTTKLSDGQLATTQGLLINTSSSTGTSLTVNNGTSTGNLLTLQDNGVNTLTVADGGAINATANSTTGTALALQANSLTTGQGLAVSSTSANITSGNVASFSQTATYTTDPTVSGSILNVSRNITNNVSSATVQRDGVTTANSGSGLTSRTFAHTVTNQTNRVLIVTVQTTGAAAPDSVTFNGSNLTMSVSNIGPGVTTSIWYMIAPPVTTANVVVTLPASALLYAQAMNTYNVNQTTPLTGGQNSSGIAGSGSLGVTSGTGDLVVDTMGITRNAVINDGAGQTEVYEVVSTSSLRANGSVENGVAGTVTMSQSPDGGADYSYSAVNIEAVASAGIGLTGALANFTSSCTETAGTCYDSASLLNLQQNFINATGSVLRVVSAGQGNLIEAIDGSTTAFSVSDGGRLLSRSTVNSTTAFQVQNASGTSILSVDTTNSLASLNGDLVVTAGNYISLTGGNTASRPASPTEGMVYFDTDTDRLMVYSNGKWQTDNREAILVAANNSSQADKDAADYVADGNTGAANDGDQIEINNALTAASGRKVVLLAGTYVADATILVPNNTTLAGVGNGTVIELADIDTTDNLIENSDTTTGTGVVIRDLKLDGRDDLNTAGTQYGVYMSGLGNGIGVGARLGGVVENITVTRFRSVGIELNNSDNNKIKGVTAKINGESGISSINSSNNTISNSLSQGNGFFGIYIDAGDYVVIDGNTLDDNSSSGIYVSSSYRTTVSNNIVENNSLNGISFNAVENSIISGNLTENSGDSGIRLDGGYGVTVSGNTSSANGANGITVIVSRSTITGNAITDNVTYGISVLGSSNTISSNNVSNNGLSTSNNGIYLSFADNNQIIGNKILDDACTTTCHAINISGATSDKNYLEANRFTGSATDAATLSDSGTNTIYVNQQTNSTTSTNSDVSDFRFRGSANSATAFAVQNASGGSVFNIDTTDFEVEIGNSTTAGELQISDGSSNFVKITASGVGSDYTLTLPTSAGNANECLQNSSTAGILTFGACGGGGSGDSISVSGVSASDANFINTTATGTVAGVTFSLNSTPAPDEISLTVSNASDTVAGVVTTAAQTFAGVKTFNSGVVLAANQSLTVTGGNTASRPGSPTEGMVYYDTETDQLLVYNGGKWIADSRDAYLVAANNSSAADKAAADYVADGTADDIEINAALDRADPASVTSGARKSGRVYLFAGTYSILDTILVRNNTTLAGSGPGTLLEFANQSGASDNIIENSDTSTGTGVVIRDMKIDGRDDLNTSGVIYGIRFSGMGSGTGASARQGGSILNIVIEDVRNAGIYLISSSNNTITGNVAQGNSFLYGIYVVTSSNNNMISNNRIQGNNSFGIYLSNTSNFNTVTGNTTEGNNNGVAISGSSFNTITGNSSIGNGTGISLSSSNNNTVSGNTAQGNTTAGISISGNENVINGNNIIDNGGATANSGITITSGDFNSVTGNLITDTSCTTTCVAINITNAASDKNYLEANRFTGSATDAATLSDSGTNTIYVNQQTNSTTSTNSDVSDFRFRGSANSATAFAVQNASGGSVFNIDTTDFEVEIGNSTTAGELQISDGSSNFVKITASGVGSDYTLTLPTSAGNANECLQNSSTAGILTFGACGGGGSGDSISVSGVSASDANFINTTATGTVAGVTFSLNSTPAPDEISLTVSNASDTVAGVVTTAAQTFAGVKTFNSGVVLAANQSLTVTGGNTASRPGSPTEGMVYFDSDTDSLLTYANGKWQSDRGEFIVVAANDSSQAEKDSADYVADGDGGGAGDGDQVQINSALTDAAGGKVILLAGTYVADATILVPNNTTLAGSGTGTVIELADLDATENLIENSDTTTGTGVVIRDLKLDGRDDLNTAGTQYGIQFSGMGDGSGASARQGGTITNVVVEDFRWNGIFFTNTDNSTIEDVTARGSNLNAGISLTGSTNNTISDSLVQGNAQAGISLLSSSTFNTISGITSQGNGGGVGLNSSNNTLSGSTIIGNTGVGVSVSSTNNTVSSNNISNGTVGINVASNNHIISGNTVSSGSSSAIVLNTAGFTTVSGNTTQGSGSSGIELFNSSINTITGNTSTGNSSNGILIDNSSNNTVDGNNTNSNGSYGIWLVTTSNNNVVSSNRVQDNGGSTANNGIRVSGGSDFNSLYNNYITDTSCTTTCVAIDINGSTNDKNYLEGNRFSGSTANAATVNDSGTNTIYVNQQTNSTTSTNSDVSDFRFRGSANSATAFAVQDANGASLFTVDTATRSGSGGNLLKVGNSTGTDTATTILQVDSATANPTTNLSALNGGLFYNSTTNKLSIIENGTVKVLCNTTDLACGSGGSLFTDAGSVTYLTSTVDTLLVGATSANGGKLEVVSTTEQLRLSYDATNRASFTISSGGDLTIAPSGNDTSITGNTAVSGNTTLGDSNTDSVTFSAGTSGTGIRLSDATFASCSALETDASGDITCGTDDLGGGSATLQGAYDNDANSSEAIIALNSTDGSLLIRDASTPLSTAFAVQNNAGSANLFAVNSNGFSAQDSSGNAGLLFDSTTSELRVYENVTSPTRYLRMYYDTAANAAVFAASSGTTQIGTSGSGGDINLQLTGASGDKLNVNKTFTLAGNYTGNDFNFVRTLTGTTYSVGGNLVKIEDLSTVTSGSSSPNLLYLNQNNTSATGNLILAQTGGATDVFRVTTNGAVTLKAGGSLDVATAGTISIGQTTATGIVLGGNSSGTTTINVANSSASAFTLQKADGTDMLVADSTNNRLSVGASDTTGTLLVLDTKTDAGDPTGVNGGMYYNSNTNTFRCYENGAWKNCITPTFREFYMCAPGNSAAGLCTTFTNQGAGFTEVANNVSRTNIDLSGFTEFRIVSLNSVAAVTGDVRIDCDTDTAFGTPTTLGTLDNPTATLNVGAWTSIGAGECKTSGGQFMRAGMVNGNGTEDPAVRLIRLQVR